MQIGVIGVGVVGGAISKVMSFVGHDVKVYDTKFDNQQIDDVLDTELCFVCVPTPTEAGVQDAEAVRKTVHALWNRLYDGVIVIKSTLLPGTTDAVRERYKGTIGAPRLAFSPEFLRERAAEVDFITQELCIVGCYDEQDFAVVRKAHEKIARRIVCTSARVAESVKYFVNVYNALRVVWANSFYEVMQAHGIPYDEVKNLAVLAGNLSGRYLDCNENVRGFGGTCLPKDSEAFAAFAGYANPGLGLFRAICAENKKFPTTVFPGMRG